MAGLTLSGESGRVPLRVAQSIKMLSKKKLSVIRILRLRSASEISIAGLVGFRFLLDSGHGFRVKLHVADAVTEAPLAAARDVDDAAPLVTAA